MSGPAVVPTDPASALARGAGRALLAAWVWGLALFVPLHLIPAWAQPPEPPAAAEVARSEVVAPRKKAVEDEAAALVKARAELEDQRTDIERRIQGLGDKEVNEAAVEEARIALEGERVNLESAGLDRAAAERTIGELGRDIDGLEKRQGELRKAPTEGEPAQGPPAQVQELEVALAEKRALLDLAKQHQANLGERLAILQQRVKLAQRWWKALQERYQAQQERAQLVSLADIERRLRAEQKEQQARAAKLQAELDALSGDSTEVADRRHLLETRIQAAEQLADLVELRIKVARAQAALDKPALRAPAGGERAPEALREAASRLQALGGQLRSLEALSGRKVQLFERQREVLKKRRDMGETLPRSYREERKALDDLVERFGRRVKEVQDLKQEVMGRHKAFQDAYREAVSQGLAARHRLPRSWEAWRQVLVELATLPGLAKTLVLDALGSLWEASGKAEGGRGAWLWVLEALWLWLGWSLWRLPLRPAGELAGLERFSARAAQMSMGLLHANRFALTLFGGLLIAAALVPVPVLTVKVIAALAGLWLGLRLAAGFAYWLLISPLIPVPQRQPGLYVRVLWLAAGMSVVGLTMAVAHLGGMSEPVRDLADRLFMLLLLPAIFLSLKLRGLLMVQLREHRAPVYWRQALGLTGLAVPLSLLATAVLGLAGYIELAWYVARNLALFLVVGAVWLVLRRLVIELSQRLGRRVEERTARGPLWRKAVIGPAQVLARVGLFLLAAWVLYRLYGGSGEVTLGSVLETWLTYPLFAIGGTTVQVVHVLESLLLVVLVVYAGIWIRQLTYDWLYTGIRDRGIRNSLSVFTQYAVVLLGLLVALNLLGIHLTSLAVFAGALGVGIGFGLQNIANNFISGLILLVERPVREADWVTISGNEGRVSRIGIRSVTVTTWDNQDVIIPNAELISNPFINWTLGDKLVRTILVIGIAYQDDPHQALDVISEAVTMQPEVSLERPPRVLLLDFGASSVDLRVEYYMDVEQFSRMEVKSKVLLAIWDALQEARISIPFPQQDVYIKELPDRAGPGTRSVAAPRDGVPGTPA